MIEGNAIDYQPIDDVIVIPRPHLQAIRVPRRNVADYVNFLAVDLCTLQLVHQPLQFAHRVRAINQQPPILVVTVIHIN